jgi:hypothetical protein
MTRVRTTLRRLLSGAADPPDADVHFHRRTGATEACYERGCSIPRLTV